MNARDGSLAVHICAYTCTMSMVEHARCCELYCPAWSRTVVRVRGPLACFSLSESGDYITLHYITSARELRALRLSSGSRLSDTSSLTDSGLR